MMTHLTDEQILAYLETPTEPDLSANAEHLADCVDCRTRATRLQQSEQRLLDHAGDITHSHSDIDAQELAEYFHGELSTARHDDLRKQLKTDPSLTKEALHFLTHQSAMESKLEPVTSVKPAEPRNLFARLSEWLREAQAPVWQTAAASFAFAFLVVVAVVPQTRGPAIVQTGTDNGLYWQTPQPGMGFFQLANAEREAFQGLTLTQQGEELLLQWPPIDGVAEYALTISTLQQGQSALINQQNVFQPLGRLDLADLIRGQHYEWLLSGRAEDGRLFQASGGFVLTGE